MDVIKTSSPSVTSLDDSQDTSLSTQTPYNPETELLSLKEVKSHTSVTLQEDVPLTCNELLFYVNGQRVLLPNPDPEMMLLNFIRRGLGLKGTKQACGEGGCGACTVMLSNFDSLTSQVSHSAVCACLVPLCSIHGRAVTTVEGLGSTRRGKRLHPVQERLAASHGTQCGYCSPGMVMSMYTLLRNNSSPRQFQVEEALEGNLCRCTGYRPILEGFKEFTVEGKCCTAQLSSGCCMLNGMTSSTGTMAKSTSTCCTTKLIGGCCINSGVIPATDAENNVDCMNQRGGPNDCITSGDQMAIVTSADRQRFTEYGEDTASSVMLSESKCDTTILMPDQELIFPNELQLRADVLNADFLNFKSERIWWFRPTTLQQLLLLKHQHPLSCIVAGNTAVGVDVKLNHTFHSIIISVTHVSELLSCELTQAGLRIGAAVTLSRLANELGNYCKELPDVETRFFTALSDMIKQVATKQIRSVGTFGGHLMAANPVSDLNPILHAAGCEAEMVSSKGQRRRVKVNERFLTELKGTSTNEVLVWIEIPKSRDHEFLVAYKQARRKTDRVANVTIAMRVLFEDEETRVLDAAISFSGLCSMTVAAVYASEALKNKWSEEMMTSVRYLLLDELEPDSEGGMTEYRRALVSNLFYKCFLAISLMKQQTTEDSDVVAQRQSAAGRIDRPIYRSTQLYERVGEEQHEMDAVGRPLPHLSSQLHTTGEAVYVDDMLPFVNELQLALVTSNRAHALIISVDPSDALKIPGVLDFIDHRDVIGSNVKGQGDDEEIFRVQSVTSEGQTIGAVLAETVEIAQRAARAVKIEYNVLPSILTIEDAIKHDSFLNIPERKLSRGDIGMGMKESDHVIVGSFYLGGQKHFYMETQACLAVPLTERDELEVFSSTQSMTSMQALISKALNIQRNRITVRVKRLGGAFGGKETNSFLVAVPAAIAAHKHRQPVRCVLDRYENMSIAGGRHPFLAQYKVGFSKAGKILALEIQVYTNGGYSNDLSLEIYEVSLQHMENCYMIPNILFTGRVCRTNLPSNTAFRGFGTPQGIAISEQCITAVASFLQIDPIVVRETNFFNEGNKTCFGQEVTECDVLHRVWREMLQSSDYYLRKEEIAKFNKLNRWKKHGLACVPVKYGFGFGTILEQGGASVHVYLDGSVLLSHGGVEMGQGLFTKMTQVASRVLAIPASQIHTRETSSSSVANAVTTAASRSSDIYGTAVIDACRTIMQRLEPYRKANPDAGWNKWVMDSYRDRVCLSAFGFYSCPDLYFDWETQTGNPFKYFSFGAACTEVELDCLTGEHTVRRVDIVMDVGKSLNPAIDIGQIEGGFMQGYGMFVLEQVKHDLDGLIHSKGPSTYRLPAVSDIPVEFNVSLLKDSTNSKAVYSSKGIGEPPLILATSVFFALREAVTAARSEEGKSGEFTLNSPATAEALVMAILQS